MAWSDGQNETYGSSPNPETDKGCCTCQQSGEREKGLENKTLSSRARLRVFIDAVGFVFTPTLSGHLGSFSDMVHSFLPGTEPGEK